MNTQTKCKDRVKAECEARMRDIRDMWAWSHHQLDDASEDACKDFLRRFDQSIDDLVRVAGPTLGELREYTREVADNLLNEYGLSWDYVPPGTFDGQRRGYFRWQLSWGGPSDEFRFFCDEQLSVCRVEYWFMDWFDGAKLTMRGGSDFDVLNEIWVDLKECDMPKQWMVEAGAEVNP